ncbi:hypothetical protein CEXT_522571 [Caerostris extrusa]|uniref:Uncharacterized protein n=1 Tax=Caerostris extrusa TaxID=172846 RepID=A0AAV4MNI8_CAEEX|nr:hypothetical protein CEXT_522571 [Caerostris extrusa]
MKKAFSDKLMLISSLSRPLLRRSAPLAAASREAQLSPNAFNEVVPKCRSKTPDLNGIDPRRPPLRSETIPVTIDGAPAALSIGWGKEMEIPGQLIIRTVIAPPTPLAGRKSIREEIEIGVNSKSSPVKTITKETRKFGLLLVRLRGALRGAWAQLSPNTFNEVGSAAARHPICGIDPRQPPLRSGNYSPNYRWGARGPFRSFPADGEGNGKFIVSL